MANKNFPIWRFLVYKGYNQDLLYDVNAVLNAFILTRSTIILLEPTFESELVSFEHFTLMCLQVAIAGLQMLNCMDLTLAMKRLQIHLDQHNLTLLHHKFIEASAEENSHLFTFLQVCFIPMHLTRINYDQKRIANWCKLWPYFHLVEPRTFFYS